MAGRVEFPEPPRITGNTAADVAAMGEYLWSLYRDAFLARGLIQDGDEDAVFTGTIRGNANLEIDGHIIARGMIEVDGVDVTITGIADDENGYGMYGVNLATYGNGMLAIGAEGLFGFSTVYDGILGIGAEYGGWFSGDLAGIRAGGGAAGASGVYAKQSLGDWSITAEGPMRIDDQVMSTLADGTPPLVVTSTTPVLNMRLSKAGLKASGVVTTLSTNYVSMTGTAGADNTAQTVKTIAIAANTLTQIGDRVRIRCYWRGDTGTGITGTLTVNGVTVSVNTDAGAATVQTCDAWLHYGDATHANIMSVNSSGWSTTVSNTNVAGFDWTASQDVDIDQDAIANNHIIVYFLAVDVFPKGSTD